MTLPSGQAEKEIRRAAVSKLREWWPAGRICHEVNVRGGIHRADLMCVLPSQLIVVELKSFRDNLVKLHAQIDAFSEIAHLTIVCHDQKWPTNNVRRVLGWRGDVIQWMYTGGGRIVSEARANLWTATERFNVPWTIRMLDLLWAEELNRVCDRLHVPVPRRASRAVMKHALQRQCNGADLEDNVCRELRGRKFANADDAIVIEHDTPAEQYIRDQRELSV